MSKTTPAYFITKPRIKGDDTYYWNPAPSLRELGWSQIIFYTNGLHSIKYVAMQQADWVNAILAAWRKNDITQAQNILDLWADGKTHKYQLKNGTHKQLHIAPITKINIPSLKLKNDPAEQTLKKLIIDYKDSSSFTRLKPKTQADYSYHLNALDDDIGFFEEANRDTLVTDLGRRFVVGYYEKLHKKISPNLAKARLTIVRRLLNHALNLEWIKTNPALNMNMQGSKPRVVVWTNDEILEFVKQADEMLLPSIADAVILACHTAQRQTDILELTQSQYIQALDDSQQSTMRTIQNKTTELVNVPLTPIAEQRVKTAIERNIKYRSKYKIVDVINPLIICEKTLGRRSQCHIWKQKSFNTWFNKVKAKVIETQPDFADKKFQDLRDTAVTILARADVNEFGIASITGHSFTSIMQILKHYLALDQKMANDAIKKMVKHLDGQLIK